MVTADVGALTLEEVERALARGAEEAERMRSDGLIATAVLCLEDRVEMVATRADTRSTLGAVTLP